MCRVEALEELRLLSCIDSQDRRIVSIVLTGQPALDEVLDDASLAQLRQRTRLRQRLRPMDESVTADYIRHRLKVAGGKAVEPSRARCNAGVEKRGDGHADRKIHADVDKVLHRRTESRDQTIASVGLRIGMRVIMRMIATAG